MAISSPPFYTKHIQLPDANYPTPSYILNNPKLFPFLKDSEQDGSCNRKGGLSQNCLACCSFDLQFLYVVSGWEGSAADGALFLSSCFNDLTIPTGKFYLANAGFGTCDALLVPYHGVQYHLIEWGHANLQSVTLVVLPFQLLK